METTLVINQQSADFELFYGIILADGAPVATPVPAVAWLESFRRSPAIRGTRCEKVGKSGCCSSW